MPTVPTALSFKLLFSAQFFFFFSSRRRHTRCLSDWSSDVCSSDLDDRARVLLVKGADEAAARDAEERYGVDVFRLGAAHDDLLHAVVPAGDQIRIAEEKTTRADSGQCLNVRSGIADEAGVVVLKILAYANPLRPARGVRARRKPRDKVGAGAQRLHAVLHELVEALDDRGHGNHRGHADDDAQHG